LVVNGTRGVFKTVFPKPGGRVWYDDQREVHQQIFAGVDTIGYAFMGTDPNAADNRWLRQAFAHIVADADETMGHAVVPNGIPLSKIHHAAFDAHLPRRAKDYPDRDRLSLRFERFRSAY